MAAFGQRSPAAVELQPDLIHFTTRIVDDSGRGIAGVRFESVPSLERVVLLDRGLYNVAFGRALPLRSIPSARCVSGEDGVLNGLIPKGTDNILLRLPNGAASLSPLTVSSGTDSELSFGTLRMSSWRTATFNLVDKKTRAPIQGATVRLMHDSGDDCVDESATKGSAALCLLPKEGAGVAWESPRFSQGAPWVIGLQRNRFWSKGVTDKGGYLTLPCLHDWYILLSIDHEGVSYFIRWRVPESGGTHLDLGPIEVEEPSTVRLKVDATAPDPRVPMEFLVGTLAHGTWRADTSDRDADLPGMKLMGATYVSLSPASQVGESGSIEVRNVQDATIIVASRPIGAVEWSVNKLSLADIEAKRVHANKRQSVEVSVTDAEGKAIEANVCALPLFGTLGPCASTETTLGLTLPTATLASPRRTATGGQVIENLLEISHVIVAEAPGFVRSFAMSDGHTPNATIVMQPLERHKIHATLGTASNAKPLISTSVTWRVVDDWEKEISGTLELDENGDGELAAPTGAQVAFVGPSGNRTNLKVWGSASAIRFEPPLRISGRVREGGGAPETIYIIRCTTGDAQDSDEPAHSFLTSGDGHFSFDVPRETNLILRVLPFHKDVLGFETSDVYRPESNEVEPCWAVPDNGADEISMDIDLQAPPRACDGSHRRTVGHLVVPDDKEYWVWAQISSSADRYAIRARVRKSGWFDCGDLRPGHYTFAVKSRASDGEYQTVLTKSMNIEPGADTVVLELDAG